MRRALLAVLLLAAPAAASPVCESSWQDSYAAEWGYSKERWLGDCRADIDPAAGLRRAQSDFMAACKRRFSGPDAGAARAQAEIYCALGKPGRAKLYALAGLADPDAAPPPPPPVEDFHIPPPGVGGMGPLMTALRSARSVWQPDACFSGLEFSYAVTKLTTLEDLARAQKAHETPHYGRSAVEVYEYAFASAAVPHGGYRVSFGDKMDAMFCTDLVRGLGPDSGGFPELSFYGSCLKGATLDLTQALGIVMNPSDAATDTRARLGTLTAAFLASPDCEVRAPGGIRGRACAKVAGWDKSTLRRAVGREVWAVSHGDRTDFVDAGSGARLGSARGWLHLPSMTSTALYGGHCPPDRREL